MPHFKTSDGVDLYYEDYGKGPALVFVHGWPLSGAMWEYQVVPLVEAGFRCISYDRRGFGRSDKPAAGYDYATFGRDCAELIDALKLEQITLIGFSMGGGEVVEVLTRHGAKSRVGKAVLVASIVPYLLKTDDNPDGVEQKVFDGMVAGLKADRPAFLTNFTETFFGVGLLSSPVSAPLLAANCEVAMTASPIATIQCVRAFSSTDFRARCKDITQPVLIIHGDGDSIVPIDPTSKCAAGIIPNAELELYENAPHGLYFTHRERLTEDIAAFAGEGAIAAAKPQAKKAKART